MLDGGISSADPHMFSMFSIPMASGPSHEKKTVHCGKRNPASKDSAILVARSLLKIIDSCLKDI